MLIIFIFQTMQSIQNLQRHSLLLILVKKVRNLVGVVTLVLPIFNRTFQLPLQKLLLPIPWCLILQNQKKLHLILNVNLCSMHLTLVKKSCYKLLAHFRVWKVNLKIFIIYLFLFAENLFFKEKKNFFYKM